MADLLEKIRLATYERGEAEFRARECEKEWRRLISAAVTEGLPTTHIAAAAGVTRQRVDQIRKGKR